MTDPFVSVVIPAWNSASTIERALDSVLDSSERELECIVVDDGSSDDTAQVARRRAERDPRLRVIASARNAGVSVARNRALEVAQGTWLTFLDADDRLLPGGLEALVAGARQAGVRAVVGQRIWSDGRRTWRTAAYDIPDIREAGRKALATHPGLMFYASATGKLFHRSITDGLRFEGRVLGDQPWTLRALLRAGGDILVIADDVYEWRRPAPGGRDTITAAKHESAALAADAVRIAIRALAEVSAEADACLPEAADRSVVVRGYLDRLVRSDIAGPVARAVARRDPGGAQLFDAIRAFLEAAPPEVVEDSDAVARVILRPPIDWWLLLTPRTRAAFWSLLDWVARDRPGLIARVSRVGPVRLGFARLRRSSGQPNRAITSVLFTLNWPIALARVAARLLRARIRPLRTRLVRKAPDTPRLAMPDDPPAG
ncbi:MAG TPA: glycosyltransferase family 2 protein [Candidatus Limnocylindrales bacterium]|nr:glycosyltransferase family 2 protein [Candidatus Limnocylindrales bacterium]